MREPIHIANSRAAFSPTQSTAASGAMFREIICLPPVATKTTGVSLSRRLSRGVHFPPVRARDNLRRRGVPAKTGQLRDEATGGRQDQAHHSWYISGPHSSDYYLLQDEQSDSIFATRLAEHIREASGICDERGGSVTARLFEMWIDDTEKHVWYVFVVNPCHNRGFACVL